MRKLFRFFRRDRESLQAILNIYFVSQDLMVPQIHWKKSQDYGTDTIRLLIYYYARILYELAELNENRVARELIDFVGRIAKRLLNLAAAEPRFKIPMGKLQLAKSLEQPADRLYEAKFYALGNGSYRLDFQGVIGKENYFLPASVLGLLQFSIDSLETAYLTELSQGLEKLHYYYRFRQDFWEGTSLVHGPRFALGKEKIPASQKPKEEKFQK
ncbi:MAG: hypothetical protein BZ151_06535 [Desulfobacca sp. 4484_104]|nr:MAG: hypothetical protein BZ151_06535 [Desulfobacca sp. 4484_104]RLA86806.1 MAG: hypothetical protein DRG58_11580 [Deltaproteobacteria bacterium]